MNVGFGQVDHAPFSKITEAKLASIDDVDMAPWKQADSFFRESNIINAGREINEEVGFRLKS